MVARALPDPNQDLFELYSLTDVAESVARVLRNGEKNALRKTYKGHIKKLGVAGKFDVKVNHEAESGGGLVGMVFQPDEEWNAYNVRGREIENGLSGSTATSLEKAFVMAKGAIPKSRWDSSVLGELDVVDKKATASILTGKPSSQPASTSSQSISASRGGKVEAARPRRNVKKRHYEDSSFEGYGEGYVDDDLPDAGFSDGEGNGRSSTAKRRKKTQNGGSYTSMPSMRHNSYGPGMVGV